MCSSPLLGVTQTKQKHNLDARPIPGQSPIFQNNSDHPHPPYLQKDNPQNMPYNGGLYGIKVG